MRGRKQRIGRNSRFAQQPPRGWLRAAQDDTVSPQHFSSQVIYYGGAAFSRHSNFILEHPFVSLRPLFLIAVVGKRSPFAICCWNIFRFVLAERKIKGASCLSSGLMLLQQLMYYLSRKMETEYKLGIANVIDNRLRRMAKLYYLMFQAFSLIDLGAAVLAPSYS